MQELQALPELKQRLQVKLLSSVHTSESNDYTDAPYSPQHLTSPLTPASLNYEHEPPQSPPMRIVGKDSKFNATERVLPLQKNVNIRRRREDNQSSGHGRKTSDLFINDTDERNYPGSLESSKSKVTTQLGGVASPRRTDNTAAFEEHINRFKAMASNTIDRSYLEVADPKKARKRSQQQDFRSGLNKI